MSSKWPDPTRTTELPALTRLKIDVATFSRLFLIRSIPYLNTCSHAGKLGGVRNSARSDHRLQSKLPLSVRKNPHRHILGKRCCHFFSTVLVQILFILASNGDIYKSLNEFEISPDPSTDHRFSCH